MSRQGKWIWRIYLAIFFWSAVKGALSFFVYRSKIFWYYQILIAVDSWFMFPYLITALSILLKIVSLIALFGFIEKRLLLSRHFWGIFLVFRLAAELFGKSYEIKDIQSLAMQSHIQAGVVVLAGILFLLPSYMANLLYVKDWEKLSPTRA